MRFTLLLFTLLLSLQSYSQTYGLFGGVNVGRFYDLRKNEGNFYKKYTGESGTTFRFEIKDISIDSLPKMSLALSYQSYGGYFLSRDGSPGGISKDEGTIRSQIIGLEFYPIHFLIKKHVRLSLGISANRLIDYRVSGRRIVSSGSGMNYISADISLNELDSFVRLYSMGAVSSMGYEFKIGKILIAPCYGFYLGLTNEFNESPALTRSMRHSFMLGIGYTLKN